MKRTGKQHVIDTTTASTGNADFRDSGVAWLGSIPSHWRLARMRHVSQAISGGTPSKENPDYWNGDVPWVSPKDMKRRVIDSSEDTITDSAVAETGLKIIDPGSILIVVRGMILAHSFPVAITSVPVTINQDMKAIRFHEDLDPEFAAWYLTGVGRYILASIVEEAGHGTRVIRMDEWKSVSVPVPPLDEQRAIVRYLGTETTAIDRVIAKHNELQVLIARHSTSTIYRAVTQGTRAGSSLRPSSLAGIEFAPRDWPLEKVSWLFTIGSGTTPKSDEPSYYDGEIPWVTTSELRESVVLETEKKVTRAALEAHTSLKQYRAGSVVLAMYGATIGRIGILGVDATVNQACCVFSEPRKIQPKFWYYWLLMRRSYLESLAYGGGQPNLSQDTVKALRVALPPMKEQDAIIQYLDDVVPDYGALVSKIEASKKLLMQYRLAIITAAVTGKLDLRTRTP